VTWSSAAISDAKAAVAAHFCAAGPHQWSLRFALGTRCWPLCLWETSTNAGQQLLCRLGAAPSDKPQSPNWGSTSYLAT